MDRIDYSENLPVKWTDTLSKLTDLTFLICKEEKYYSCQEGENPLCLMLQEHTSGKTFCEQGCTAPLVQAINKGEPVYFKCYARLNNVAMPVYSNGNHGNRFLILGGRIISSYDDLIGYRVVAEKLGCEPDRVLELVKCISFKDVNNFKSSMEAARDATDYLIRDTVSIKKAGNEIARLNTIINIAATIGSLADNREVFNTILNTLGVLFNVRTAMILIRDVKDDKFISAGTFGEGLEMLAGFQSMGDEGLIGDAVVRNDAVSSTELLDILKSGFPNVCTSVRIYPISMNNRVNGLIVILDTPLSDNDEALIMSFCRCISLAFEQRLFMSDRETIVKECYALLQALYSISSYIDSEKLFNVIIEKAAEVVGAGQGSIMLLDEDRYDLEVKATKGLNPAILNQIRIKPGEGIAGGVLESGAPLVVSNIEEDKRVSRANRVRYRTKSFISLPLKTMDRCIGVMNLADKENDTDFSDEDLKFLEVIGLYSVVAIERRFYYQSTISLRKISITDSLTGLLNRRYFEERISEEMERSKRYAQSFSLIILDIDDFKDFNDTYGHLYGDEVLKNSTHGIRQSIRIIDIAARYGGEEFAVILPTTEKEDARLIGERIRSGIENMSLAIKDTGEAAKLTVSLGIASYPGDASTVEDLINNADRALYKAKGLGKNRVVLFGSF